MEQYAPQYFLHGHVHLQYAPNLPRVRQYGETTVVNASGKYLIELPDRPQAALARGWKGWLAGWTE